jgi:DNA-binding transcriptional LysR family regulator
MDRLTAMRVFVLTAERGSLTQAAELLDMSRAMASRHLAGLERALGNRLLHRTTRRTSLTDAGDEALARCRQMLALDDEMQALAGSRRDEPAGRLRVAAPVSLAQSQLTQAVVAFQATHPRVDVELLTVDRPVDLVEERIDLAVRVTNRLDDGLVARRLADCRSVLCAAPAYLKRHAAPQRIEDLAQHPCISHEFAARAQYRLRHDGRTVAVAVTSHLSSNETAVVRQAALAGAGIAMLPTYYVADDLARHALLRVLPAHEPELLGIHAVTLSRRHPPRAVKLFIAFLAERFGGDVAPWDRAPR